MYKGGGIYVAPLWASLLAPNRGPSGPDVGTVDMTLDLIVDVVGIPYSVLGVITQGLGPL